MGGKSSPPPAPDYAAAAEQTGEDARQLVEQQTHANRIDQYSPWGSTEYESYRPMLTPGTGGRAQVGTAAVAAIPGRLEGGTGYYANRRYPGTPAVAASADYQPAVAGIEATYGPERWRQTTTLAPDAQRALDAEMKLMGDKSELAGSLVGRMQDEFGAPLDYSGLPQYGGVPQAGNLQAGNLQPGQQTQGSNLQGGNLQTGQQPQSSNLQAGNLQTGDQVQAGNIQANNLQVGDQTQAGQLTAEEIQRGVDFTGAEQRTGAEQARQNAEDAIYGRSTSRLDPQWEQRTSQKEAQLAAQGLRPGDKAYDQAMENMGRERTDAYQQAQYGSIMGGGQEASRTVDMQRAGREQDMQEQLRSGSFANTAAGQAFGQAQQAGGQNFQQQLASENQRFGQEQAATGQNFSQEMAAGGQNFQQNLASEQERFMQEAMAGGQNFEQASQAAQVNFGQQLSAEKERFMQEAMAGGQNFDQAARAADMNFGQAMSSEDQRFGQAAQAGQQNFAQQGAAGQQNFNQQTSQSQQQSQLRQAQMAEMLQQRGASLNEINAIMSGQQVAMPNMPDYNTAGRAAPVDYMGAVSGQYGADMDRYNAKQAQQNSMMSGIGSMVSAGMMMSDRRLKRHIKRIGTFKRYPWYSFQYIWGEWATGVMADEVNNDAVVILPNGFAAVDYARIN